MMWMARRVAAALAGFLALLVLYGVLLEPRLLLDEERVEARLPRLPPEWAGTTVAVLSDIQVGMWWANTGMVRRAVERVVAADPAAVLLAGDFVYSTTPSVAYQVDVVVELLRPLVDADLPTYAVLGNHDYDVDAADELTEALQDAGIVVLRNESAAIPPPSGTDTPPLYVVGLGPALGDRTDVDAALADVPADGARLVLMHNPTSFPLLPAASAPFAVAGHTHCGQIALPGTGSWSYLGLSDEEAAVAEGPAPADYGATGNSLFVTCGIGFSRLPIRVNAPPQVLFVELVPGEV